MTFASIPNGSQVFIDANVLIYHATADPVYGAAARQLMARIARQEIQGFTSSHGLCDLAHRVMTTEAMIQLGWPSKGIGPRLRRNPTQVQKLPSLLSMQVPCLTPPLDTELAVGMLAPHGLMMFPGQFLQLLTVKDPKKMLLPVGGGHAPATHVYSLLFPVGTKTS